MGIQSLLSNLFQNINPVKLFPFLVWSKWITRETLHADIMAGLTGAVIVLPQGIAYALIAGLPPEYGLYTAIITPIVAGLFGSSLHLISGPTAAISIVVMSTVSGVTTPGTPEFITLTLTITLLAGIIQLGLGLARLGVLVNFISHTVVLGFTAGAAVLIGTSQVKYVMGVELERGLSFAETWIQLAQAIPSVNGLALAIAAVTVISTLAIKKINKKWPSMLIGMVIGSVFCWLFNGEDHGISLVGELPGNLPSLSAPELSTELLSTLLPGAFAIAILGLVEAVSIARAIAIRSGQRIHGSQEFIGQGLSNVVGSFFSCYAGSGSFTRSGANYDAGAQTPLAALFAALILVVILITIPGITAYLPLPAMGGAILLVAWNLIDVHHITQVLKSNKAEAAVLLMTSLSTLFVELEFAIYIGVILSLTLYLRRTSKPAVVEVAPKTYDGHRYFRSIHRHGLTECPQLKVIRIDGSVFFGSVDHIQTKIQAFCADHGEGEQKHVLLHCPGITFIDIAGAEMLLQERKRFEKMGGSLSFSAMKNNVKDELEDINYLDQLGAENFYATPNIALIELIPRLNQSICDTCEKRIFKVCPGREYEY